MKIIFILIQVTDRVKSEKDVDGLSTVNEGKVATGDLKSGFVPCTPAGCIDLIKRSGIDIVGSRAVVIGESGFRKTFLFITLSQFNPYNYLIRWFKLNSLLAMIVDLKLDPRIPKDIKTIKFKCTHSIYLSSYRDTR